MRLLYGTNNPAKLTVMRKRLALLPIELVGLSECEQSLPEVEESGESPLENARIKAVAYRNATGMHTLAADSALYLQGAGEQPGVHVRRVLSKRLDDEEMIQYYARLAASFGGRVVARYQNALCIAASDGRLFERHGDSVASEPFYLADQPHPRRTPGFPLDSLSVDILSGQYYFDLDYSRTEDDLAMSNAYKVFVQSVMAQL